MSGHTRKEIAAIVGLKERQVQFFTEQGVVVPGVDRGEGRGKTRRYSDYNVTQFRVIRSLVEFGITVGKVREIIEFTNHPSLLESYSIARSADSDLYLTVFKTDEGGLGARWVRAEYVDDYRFPVVGSDDISHLDELLIINLGRLDGRGRPLPGSESREKMEKGLKKVLEKMSK